MARAWFTAALIVLLTHSQGQFSRAVTAQQESPPVIDSRKLLEKYNGDKAAFDQQYQGKQIIVEGTVNNAATVFAPGDKRRGMLIDGIVECHGADDFLGIRIGDKVRIQGKCVGHKNNNIIPVLEDCKVIKVSGDHYPPSKSVLEAMKKLEGEWKVKWVESFGMMAAGDKAVFERVTLNGLQLEWVTVTKKGEKKYAQFRIAISPDTSPREIDILGKYTIPMIYEVDGNQLRLAMPAEPKQGAPRPTSFNSAKEKILVLVAQRKETLVEARKPDFTLTVEEFARGFVTEAAATASGKKYTDKVIELTGTVADITTAFGSRQAVISFHGAQADKNERDVLIVCGVKPALQDKAFRLSRGQKVKVTAAYVFGGKNLVSSPIHALKELSKSTIIAVTAADLAKEFATDKAAATKKYNDKADVLVTGEVIDLVEKNGFNYAKLKGDGNIRVSFTMQGGEIKHLKKGQTAQIRSNLPGPPSLADDEVSISSGFVIGAKD